MLTIRMQRLGRKGHPTYRIVVQDVRQTPTSGKYVALLGSYDPHSKTNTLVKDKAEFYLTHGARPSERVARLLEAEGIKLPEWVKRPVEHERTIRNPEKLRRNRPADESSTATADTEASEEVSGETAAEPAAETEIAPTEVAAETAETADESTADVPAAADETDTDDTTEAA